MPTERGSLQDLIRARQQSGFFGRRTQVTQFGENLALPVTSPHRRFIFNVHGDAGVGKTYLTKYLRQSADGVGVLTAYTDETEADPLSAMSAIADEFARTDNRLTEFEKRADAYKQHRYELESDPQAPEGLASFLTRTAVAVAFAAARDVPIAGSLLAPVDATAVAEQANRARSYIARKLSDHTDVSLLMSPTEQLTEAFVRGLNRVDSSRQIALFFDTYERTSQLLDRWLRDLYSGRYGDLPVTLVSTISGQYPLDLNFWGDYISVIADIPLEPFTISEARQFLASKGVVDESIIEVIMKASGRLPMWLATLADTRPGDAGAVGDPAGDAVGRFLKWEEDPARRAIAIVAALPRTFNQDVLEFLVSDQTRELFTWLIELPFVSRHMGFWKYHDVVRSAMIRLERAQSPSEWRANHVALASGYAKWAAELAGDHEEDWTNAGWMDHTCEKIYHMLCSDPVNGLSQALVTAVYAAENGIVRARQWATLFGDAGRDTGNATLLRWGERLQEAISEEDPSRYFTCLIDNGHLDERTLTLALKIRGRIYKRRRDYEEALADLDRVAQTNPDDARIQASLGDIYSWMARYDQALAHLTRAAELNPADASVFVDRGMVYLAKGNFEEAQADFDRAIDLDPAVLWPWLLRGLNYDQMRRTDLAIADFNRAIEIDPDYFMSWLFRGMTRNPITDGEQVFADLDHAIELNPERAFSFTVRGKAYRRIGRHDDALADLDRALQVDPDYIDALVERGRTYQQVGRHDDALADLNRAVHLSPENMMARIARAGAYDEAGRYEESIGDLNRAIEIAPDIPMAYSARAWHHMVLDSYEQAIADFNRAIEIKPDHDDFMGRGWAYQEIGRYEEALADFNCGIEIKADDATLLARRGETQIILGSYEAAKSDLYQAIKIEPDVASTVPASLVAPAEAYLREGKPELAAALFEAVAKIMPNSVEAHNDYAFCLLATDPHRALEELAVLDELQPARLIFIANKVLALHLLGRDEEALTIGYSDKANTPPY